MIIHFIYILLFATGTIGFQSANSIRTDGILDKDEWKGAEEYQLGDGNKLLKLQDKDVLYLAIISGNGFWGHLYLSDGEVVRIMHASAALAAVTYKKDNAVWITRNSFDYELRDTVYTEATKNRMLTYFTNNGWVANNNTLGNGTAMEFMIKIKEWRKPLWFACVLAKNDMTLYPFPLNLSDNAVLPTLVQGNTPDSLHFKPITWERLK